MTRRSSYMLILCAVMVLGVGEHPPVVHTHLTVGELFTSQGCNSCPPADRLAGRLAQNPYVLILSFHVDYWDYLGWEDTFAQPAFTERQIGYVEALKVGRPYTPQFVIDGQEQFVGSDARQITQHLNVRLSTPRHTILPYVRDQDLVVVIPPWERGAPYERRGTLWLVTFQEKAVVDVGRGENRGRRLTYTNVVRSFRRLGSWRGRALTFELPGFLAQLTQGEGIALLLQEESNGPILAAARLLWPPPQEEEDVNEEGEEEGEEGEDF